MLVVSISAVVRTAHNPRANTHTRARATLSIGAQIGQLACSGSSSDSSSGNSSNTNTNNNNNNECVYDSARVTDDKVSAAASRSFVAAAVCVCVCALA